MVVSVSCSAGSVVTLFVEVSVSEVSVLLSILTDDYVMLSDEKLSEMLHPKAPNVSISAEVAAIIFFKFI